MAAEGSNKLLSAARWKGHREMVGKENRTSRRRCMPKMRGGIVNSGSHRVPLWEGQMGERRKGKGEKGMGEGELNEVG